MTNACHTLHDSICVMSFQQSNLAEGNHVYKYDRALPGNYSTKTDGGMTKLRQQRKAS